jgi:hypothetical protein
MRVARLSCGYIQKINTPIDFWQASMKFLFRDSAHERLDNRRPRRALWRRLPSLSSSGIGQAAWFERLAVERDNFWAVVRESRRVVPGHARRRAGRHLAGLCEVRRRVGEAPLGEAVPSRP